MWKLNVGVRFLTDDRDPRALGADSLTNNSGELWALAEAFLWLRDESGDDKSVSVTLIYDSEVAKSRRTKRGTHKRGIHENAAFPLL